MVARRVEVRDGEAFYLPVPDLFESGGFHTSVIGSSVTMRESGTGNRDNFKKPWLRALEAAGFVVRRGGGPLGDGGEGEVLWSGFGLTMAYTGFFKDEGLRLIERVGDSRCGGLSRAAALAAETFIISKYGTVKRF